MNKIRLFLYPKLFEQGTITLWSSNYIGKYVLERHLDITVDSGTRNLVQIYKTIIFINSILNTKSNILDVGCGPGLYCKYLGRYHNVVGIDISIYNLEYAKANNEFGKYINIDIREYKCNNKYDIALVLYGLYSFFDYKDRLKILNNLYNSLKCKGKIFIEVFTENHYKNRKKSIDCSVISHDGMWFKSRYIEINKFKFYKSIALIQTLIIKRKIDVWNSWIKTFKKDELVKEITNCGFNVLNLYSNTYGTPFSEDSEVLCVLAERNE